MVRVKGKRKKEGRDEVTSDSARPLLPSPQTAIISLPSNLPENMDIEALSSLSLVSPFLKQFPIEIYNEVLKHCDPSTLARASRVSLAFLELSSPLLYRDVKLVGFEQMVELFFATER